MNSIISKNSGSFYSLLLFRDVMMLVSKVDIGPLRAMRSRVPPTFRTLRPINRPFVLHVGRVMKSILHFCASTSGGRLMTLISYSAYIVNKHLNKSSVTPHPTITMIGFNFKIRKHSNAAMKIRAGRNCKFPAPK